MKESRPLLGIEHLLLRGKFKRLHSLVIQDSKKTHLPSAQRNFFRALSEPDNFELLPPGLNFKKLNSKTTTSRYPLFSGFLYAMQHSSLGKQILGNESPNLYDPEPDRWSLTIRSLLSDKEVRNIFVRIQKANQQAIYPESIPALRIIINRLLPNGNGLKGYDLGCGQNVDLPLLQAEQSPVIDGFFLPYELQTYNRKVILTLGIGVDLMEPDVDWGRICTLQHYHDKELLVEAEKRYDQVIKIKSGTTNVEFVKQSATKFSPKSGEEGDFVITKWMRNQVSDQNKVRGKILKTLKERGYWISVGEEDKLRSKSQGKPLDYKSDEIWVWQKRNGKLVSVSSDRTTPKPIMTISYGNITSFDKPFFIYSSK